MKKKLFSGFLALVLALSVLPGAAFAAESQKVVHASTTEELRAALQSNTKIVLEGKDYYVLTEGNYDILDIYDLQNVTIQGTTGTRILGYIPPNANDIDSGYNGSSIWGTIIRISYSDNIVLQDLAIGFNKVPTGANKPAVQIDGKFSVAMINCEIFGASCGLELGTEEDTDGTFRMENSTIRDCFDSIVETNSMKTKSATFTNCTFSGNGYGDNEYHSEYSFHGYAIQYDLPAVFTNCVFTNNKNFHRERLIDQLADDMKTEKGPFGIYNNCTFEGNAWAEVPSSAPGSTPAKTPAKTPAAEQTPAPTPATSFSDVPSDYWASKEIAWATEKGLMNGVGDGKFKPGGNVTWQQSWMVLARMTGANPANMAEAKKWAAENIYPNVINPPTTGGTGPQVRYELMGMLFQYAGMKNIQNSIRADLKDFPDRLKENSFEDKALSWAVGNGLISGTSDGLLNPRGYVTRAQFVVIMQRFDLYIQKNAK